ncbi:MAG: hypothetical protein M0Z85_08920 [Gammaproteobacteria bacterium]|nr:hypothetical protein [Gammaproteobacteria bacterium]
MDMQQEFIDVEREIARVLRRRRDIPPAFALILQRVRNSQVIARWPRDVRDSIIRAAEAAVTTNSPTPFLYLDRVIETASRPVHWAAHEFSFRMSFWVESLIIKDRSVKDYAPPPPCFFCARSARTRSYFLEPKLKQKKALIPVCATHAPGTAGGRRAKKIAEWAGGIWGLGETYRLISSQMRSGLIPLKAVTLPATSSADWERSRDCFASHVGKTIHVFAGHDDEDGVLGNRSCGPDPNIYAAARQQVEEEYDLFVAENRRHCARLGGRPRVHSQKKIHGAMMLIKKGASLRSAAKSVGLSPSTLSRRLKSPSKAVL